MLRVLVVWLVMLSLENVVACARAAASLRMQTWVTGQLYGVPAAIAVLLPLAAIVVGLGRLVETGRARLLGLVIAFVAGALAIALSRGPHMTPLARRVPFVVVVALSAFSLAFVFVRTIRLERRRLIAAIGAALAVSSWLIDQSVLPGLYPAFHVALELASLVAAAGIVLAWQPHATRHVAVSVCGGIALWAVVALVTLQHDDHLRQAVLEDRPILGRVMLSLMQARSALGGAWSIDAEIDERDPEVSRYLDTTPGPRVLDWTGCDVLLVTIDALRADHVGAYGYQRPITPNLDRLAAHGMRFERAYTAAPSTSFAVTSILAGRNIRPLIDTGAPLPRMWPEYLRDLGYQTFASYAPEILRVDDRFAPLRSTAFGFEHVVEPVSGTSVDTLAEFLSAARPDRPLFAWIHALEPHAPYEMHPAFEMSGGRPVDAYDSEIAAVDAFIGPATEAMRIRRRCTVTIVAADHGEAFGEHGAVYHGTNVYEEQVRVPLIVVGPGVKPGVSRVPVQTIDLLPTVLSALGRPRPDSVLGRDIDPLLAGQASGGEGLAFAETDRYTMVATGSDRLLCDREARACSLYDLSTDPTERVPIETRPGRVRTLRKLTAVLGAVQESPIAFPWRRAASDFARGNAVVEGNELVASGVSGTIAYGPYIKLPAGQFELVWRGRGIASPGKLAFSVRSNGGANIATYAMVDASSLPASGELIRIPFVLARPRFEVELVVESSDGGRVALAQAELTRTSRDPRGERLMLAATQLPRDKARVVDNDRVMATGEPGTVLYGPFLTLAAGSYTCTWLGRGVPSSGHITFSVRTNHGEDVLARSEVEASALASDKLVKLEFGLYLPRDGIEFTVESSGGARVIVDQLLIDPR
ncbi:MAG: sulfatase-like hydrolase/transferase [Acidobacteriota bacterium]